MFPPTINWPDRFFQLAKHISSWSKDPNCKVGAVLVKNNAIVASGYNGFPTGIADNSRLYSEVKNDLVIHAEVNAILKAGHNSVGCHLYVTKPPCTHCAGIIIQAGIVAVFCPTLDVNSSWLANSSLATEALMEANIQVFHLRKVQ